MKRALVLAAGIGLLSTLIGCGGDSPASGSAAAPPFSATETVTVTDAVESTSTVAVATTSPSSTSSASTSTSTYVAPSTSTTVDSVALAEQKVREDFDAFHASWWACVSTLPMCDVTALRENRVDPQLSDSMTKATDWNANGYMARNLDAVTHTVISVTLNARLDVATVVDCEEDGSVRYLPDPTGAGNDQIIDDRFISSQFSWEMVLVEGRWRAKNETEILQVEGLENNLCE